VRSYHGVNSGELEELRAGFPGRFDGSVNLYLESAARYSGGQAIGPELLKGLERNYHEKEPIVIIGGKKGTSSAAICEECGEIVRCSDCEVPLTFTGSGNYGVCPYCGFRQNLVVCENCGSDELNFIGSGLEKAESEVRSLIPGAEVKRFDSQEETWEDFLEIAASLLHGGLDVLLGTKLVESLFFSGRISLVGLLDLDLLTNRPSYRSTEYLLQRVLAGLDMAKEGGDLFLQTRDTGGSPFDLITSGKLTELYESELKSRQRMGYPPYRDLLKLEVEGGEEGEAKEIALRLKRELDSTGGNFDLLGPIGNKFGTRKGKYRSDLVVKTNDAPGFLEQIHSIVSSENYREVRINPFA
jgi:primosomal protein N' (replication factor Y)